MLERLSKKPSFCEIFTIEFSLFIYIYIYMLDMGNVVSMKFINPKARGCSTRAKRGRY